MVFAFWAQSVTGAVRWTLPGDDVAELRRARWAARVCHFDITKPGE